MAVANKILISVNEIPMTYAQKIIFMGFVNHEDTTFAEFWEHIHENGKRIDYFNFNEKQLMQAWVFPDTIVEVG